jgi:hypothetical protein
MPYARIPKTAAENEPVEIAIAAVATARILLTTPIGNLLSKCPGAFNGLPVHLPLGTATSFSGPESPVLLIQ